MSSVFIPPGDQLMEVTVPVVVIPVIEPVLPEQPVFVIVIADVLIATPPVDVMVYGPDVAVHPAPSVTVNV